MEVEPSVQSSIADSENDSIQRKKQEKADKPKKEERIISVDELKNHASAGDCWVAVRGVVFDLTLFAKCLHPGGSAEIYDCKGSDATAAFDSRGHGYSHLQILEQYRIGTLETVAGSHESEFTANSQCDSPPSLQSRRSAKVAPITTDREELRRKQLEKAALHEEKLRETETMLLDKERRRLEMRQQPTFAGYPLSQPPTSVSSQVDPWEKSDDTAPTGCAAFCVIS